MRRDLGTARFYPESAGPAPCFFDRFGQRGAERDGMPEEFEHPRRGVMHVLEHLLLRLGARHHVHAGGHGSRDGPAKASDGQDHADAHEARAAELGHPRGLGAGLVGHPQGSRLHVGDRGEAARFAARELLGARARSDVVQLDVGSPHGDHHVAPGPNEGSGVGFDDAQSSVHGRVVLASHRETVNIGGRGRMAAWTQERSRLRPVSSSEASRPAPVEVVGPRAFAVLALVLPLSFAALHLRLGHAGDIEFFHRWYLAVRAGGAFYVDGPGINYPIVGVLLVSGPACLVDLLSGRALTLAEYWMVLKASLVLAEVLLVFASADLLRLLRDAQPRRSALVLFLLPSSLAGGAFFGQIDVWGTLFLVLSAAFVVRFRRDRGTAPLVLSLLFVALAILTKQLTWFAIPALLLGLAETLIRYGSRAQRLLALASPLLLFVADPFLDVPGLSHLFFVLTHGSSHGDVVVASGASLWCLVASGGTPASELSLFGLSSQVWGWLAFASSQLLLFVRIGRHPQDRTLVLAAGFGQLAMALLLTGVHERYLTHALPLLLIATGFHRRPASVLGVLVAFVSGLFVLSTLVEGLGAPLSWPQPTALLSLGWGIAIALAAKGPAARRPDAP